MRRTFSVDMEMGYIEMQKMCLKRGKWTHRWKWNQGPFAALNMTPENHRIWILGPPYTLNMDHVIIVQVCFIRLLKRNSVLLNGPFAIALYILYKNIFMLFYTTGFCILYLIALGSKQMHDSSRICRETVTENRWIW